MLTDLSKILKLPIKDSKLVETALTHSSYANLHHLQSNERLEFLGDAVLSSIVAEELFTKFPKETEGKLTQLRSQIIQGKSLAKVAQELGLEKFLKYKLSSPSPATVQNLLEQAFEALIGAIFLQFGHEKTQKFILRVLPIGEFLQLSTNPKGQLQEFLQPKITTEEIEYRDVKESGPGHKKEFTVELFVKNKHLATATAGNKKAAQEMAAEIALRNLKKD